MKNLSQLGLNLKTLKISDMGTLVSSLNYNFSMLLKLPAFKGIKGDEGDDGIGISGVRGSAWSVIDTTLSTDILSFYNLNSPNQITLSFVNTQLSFDLPNFLINFGYSELVDGDILVLPDLSVITYDELQTQFTDTGITFSNGSSLTVSQVQTIVTNMLSGVSSNDSVDTIFLAVAKLYSDLGGGINTTSNNDSVLDIPVVGAGGGVQLPDYKIISPKESKLAVTDNPMYVRGVSQDYHTLVQSTLTVDTHDYAAGVDNTPIMTILQNDYKSGLFLGHRHETSMRLFSKIYKTGSNSLRITSRNELNDENMAFLDLGAVEATLFAKDTVKIGTQSANGSLEILTETVIQKFLTLDSISEFGNSIDGLRLNTRFDELFIYSDIGQEANFLSLNNNKLVDSGYGVSINYLDNSPTQLVTSDLMQQMAAALQGNINNNSTNIGNFIQQIMDENHFIQRGTAPQDLNLAINAGIYEISPNQPLQYSNMPLQGGVNPTLIDLSSGGTDGGQLLTFRYDENKTLSFSSYGTIFQVLVMNIPPDFALDPPPRDRGQSIFMRNATNSSGSWLFTPWSLMYHTSNYDMQGTGLQFVYELLDNKFTLNLEGGVSSHTSLSTGVNYPTASIVEPIVQNLSVDTHGRVHSATISDMNEIMKKYVPEGTVIMWSGDLIAQQAIMANNGWLLCNSTGNSINSIVPDLSGRFIAALDQGNLNFDTIGKATDNQYNSQGITVTGEGGAALVRKINLPSINLTVQGNSIEDTPTIPPFLSQAYGLFPNINSDPVTYNTVLNSDPNKTEANLTRQYALQTELLGNDIPIQVLPRYYTLAFFCKVY